MSTSPNQFVYQAEIERNLQHQFEDGHVADEQFMFTMLQHGFVGMDGFKYCWPEEARENRRRTLAALPERLRVSRSVA